MNNLGTPETFKQTNEEFQIPSETKHSAFHGPRTAFGLFPSIPVIPLIKGDIFGKISFYCTAMLVYQPKCTV